MKEPKTLKDLQKEHEWNFDTYNALRQEAIKWIKSISKGGFDTRPKLFGMPIELDASLKNYEIKFTTEDVSRYSLVQESDIVVRWIKHFFNITEDELEEVNK